MINETFGKYKIIKHLGIGGTAEVYLVRQNLDSKTYALKLWREGSVTAEQFSTLIKRELDLIGKHNFPGLVRPFEIIELNENSDGLILEYCPGLSLDNFIDSIENNKPELILNIISSISINLYYLKLRGISHGDLKPQNIFLPDLNKSRGDFFYTKLSDFSLAMESIDEYTTRLGLGTIGYCAPETIDNKILNHRSDIFALGVTAYQLLTGQHPFMQKETDPVLINSRIKEHTPATPNELDSRVSLPLSNLVMQMIEKEPKERPNNGFEICQSLENMGADYQYKKIIRPKHLISQLDQPAEEVLKKQIWSFGEEETNYIKRISGGSSQNLRHILEINFSTDKLRWENSTLIWKDKIKWPARFSNKARQKFHRFSYSHKKELIKTAIIGSFQEAALLGFEFDQESTVEMEPVLEYLQINLSPVTIIRFSNILGRLARDKYTNPLLAAQLFIKGRNIDEAYNPTIDTAQELINENCSREAIGLLSRLLELISPDHDNIKWRQVSLILADTLKQAGDISDSEKYYVGILESYKNKEDDKFLAATYKNLGDLYKIKRDYPNGIEALLKAEKIYTGLNDQLELSHTMNNLGTIYSINSQFGEAIKVFRRALKIQHRMKVTRDVASTLNNLSVVYFFRGRLSRTLRLFKLALKLQREIGEIGEIARTLNNLGNVYNELGYFDNALESLKESFELNKKIGSKNELLYNYDNLTTIMLTAGKLKEAIDLLKKGMKLADELDDKPFAAIFKANIGSVQKRMGYYGRAINNFESTLATSDQTRDDILKVHCLIELSDIYTKLNITAKAREYLDQAVSLVEKIDDKKSIIMERLIRGELEEKIGLLNNAHEYAAKIKADRYIKIAHLRTARLLVKTGDFLKLKDILDTLSGYFQTEGSDIEKALFYNLYGSYYLSVEKHKEAERSYIEAMNYARQSSLIPETIDAYAGLGRVALKNKEYEAAFANFRKAVDHLKIIAGDLNKKEIREAFLSREDNCTLMNEIGLLKSIISGKKKAGSF